MRRALVLAIAALAALAAPAAPAALAALAGCERDLERMNDQPRCEPLDRRPWLPDQRCDQAAPPATVPWRGAQAAEAEAPAPPPSRPLIARGADRYRRFCAPCHGALGDALTPVARDMTLRPPPSLHAPLIVGYPDRRIFEVIGAGYGLMPPYGDVLPPADRWAVVHYVRVLQRSQAVPLAQLAPARREEARRWLP